MQPATQQEQGVLVHAFYEYLEDYFQRPDAKSKRRLAMDAGITREYLHKLLDIKRGVSFEVAEQLAIAMGTTIGKIDRMSVNCS